MQYRRDTRGLRFSGGLGGFAPAVQRELTTDRAEGEESAVPFNFDQLGFEGAGHLLHQRGAGAGAAQPEAGAAGVCGHPCQALVVQADDVKGGLMGVRFQHFVFGGFQVEQLLARRYSPATREEPWPPAYR